MLRVGLTGGIGSGKSTVGALLAEHGALVIDSDALAREVVAAGSTGLAAVVDAFGPEVLTATGELDRAAMGRRVFADPAARTRLEAVIHPLVRRRAAEIEATAPTDAVVVHDIPLLVETRQAGDFDVVVVVDAPVEIQIDRLTRERGMTAEEARSRIDAQASREERLAAADHVVANDATRVQLSQAVDRLWTQLSRHRDGGG
ncbi:MAG: dephospho-CoA kinase [Nocardioidaceae bacterium]|nr:dephospho-CoA kinase [Nocardioidaceae bacterium]